MRCLFRCRRSQDVLDSVIITDEGKNHTNESQASIVAPLSNDIEKDRPTVITPLPSPEENISTKKVKKQIFNHQKKENRERSRREKEQKKKKKNRKSLSSKEEERIPTKPVAAVVVDVNHVIVCKEDIEKDRPTVTTPLPSPEEKSSTTKVKKQTSNYQKKENRTKHRREKEHKKKKENRKALSSKEELVVEVDHVTVRKDDVDVDARRTSSTSRIKRYKDDNPIDSSKKSSRITTDQCAGATIQEEYLKTGMTPSERVVIVPTTITTNENTFIENVQKAAKKDDTTTTFTTTFRKDKNKDSSPTARHVDADVIMEESDSNEKNYISHHHHQQNFSQRRDDPKKSNPQQLQQLHSPHPEEEEDEILFTTNVRQIRSDAIPIVTPTNVLEQIITTQDHTTTTTVGLESLYNEIELWLLSPPHPNPTLPREHVKSSITSTPKEYRNDAILVNHMSYTRPIAVQTIPPTEVGGRYDNVMCSDCVHESQAIYENIMAWLSSTCTTSALEEESEEDDSVVASSSLNEYEYHYTTNISNSMSIDYSQSFPDDDIDDDDNLVYDTTMETHNSSSCGDNVVARGVEGVYQEIQSWLFTPTNNTQYQSINHYHQKENKIFHSNEESSIEKNDNDIDILLDVVAYKKETQDFVSLKGTNDRHIFLAGTLTDSIENSTTFTTTLLKEKVSSPPHTTILKQAPITNIKNTTDTLELSTSTNNKTKSTISTSDIWSTADTLVDDFIDTCFYPTTTTSNDEDTISVSSNTSSLWVVQQKPEHQHRKSSLLDLLGCTGAGFSQSSFRNSIRPCFILQSMEDEDEDDAAMDCSSSTITTTSDYTTSLYATRNCNDRYPHLHNDALSSSGTTRYNKDVTLRSWNCTSLPPPPSSSSKSRSSHSSNNESKQRIEPLDITLVEHQQPQTQTQNHDDDDITTTYTTSPYWNNYNNDMNQGSATGASTILEGYDYTTPTNSAALVQRLLSSSAALYESSAIAAIENQPLATNLKSASFHKDENDDENDDENFQPLNKMRNEYYHRNNNENDTTEEYNYSSSTGIETIPRPTSPSTSASLSMVIKQPYNHTSILLQGEESESDNDEDDGSLLEIINDTICNHCTTANDDTINDDYTLIYKHYTTSTGIETILLSTEKKISSSFLPPLPKEDYDDDYKDNSSFVELIHYDNTPFSSSILKNSCTTVLDHNTGPEEEETEEVEVFLQHSYPPELYENILPSSYPSTTQVTTTSEDTQEDDLFSRTSSTNSIEEEDTNTNHASCKQEFLPTTSSSTSTTASDEDEEIVHYNNIGERIVVSYLQNNFMEEEYDDIEISFLSNNATTITNHNDSYGNMEDTILQETEDECYFDDGNDDYHESIEISINDNKDDSENIEISFKSFTEETTHFLDDKTKIALVGHASTIQNTKNDATTPPTDDSTTCKGTPSNLLQSQQHQHQTQQTTCSMQQKIKILKRQLPMLQQTLSEEQIQFFSLLWNAYFSAAGTTIMNTTASTSSGCCFILSDGQVICHTNHKNSSSTNTTTNNTNTNNDTITLLNAGDVCGWREFLYKKEKDNNDQKANMDHMSSKILIAKTNVILLCIHPTNYKQLTCTNDVKEYGIILDCILQSYQRKRWMNVPLLQQSNISHTNLHYLTTSLLQTHIYKYNEYILLQNTRTQTPSIYFIIYGKVLMKDIQNNICFELGHEDYFTSECSGDTDRSIVVRALENTKCEVLPLCLLDHLLCRNTS